MAVRTATTQSTSRLRPPTIKSQAQELSIATEELKDVLEVSPEVVFKESTTAAWKSVLELWNLVNGGGREGISTIRNGLERTLGEACEVAPTDTRRDQYIKLHLEHARDRVKAAKSHQGGPWRKFEDAADIGPILAGAWWATCSADGETQLAFVKKILAFEDLNDSTMEAMTKAGAWWGRFRGSSLAPHHKALLRVSSFAACLHITADELTGTPSEAKIREAANAYEAAMECLAANKPNEVNRDELMTAIEIVKSVLARLKAGIDRPKETAVAEEQNDLVH